MSKRDKIRRLAEQSGFAGERAAAQAALERMRDPETLGEKPMPGSPGWREAMTRHRALVQECAIHIGDPDLTPAEVATVRRWARFIGNPWESGAEELRRIHRKVH